MKLTRFVLMILTAVALMAAPQATPPAKTSAKTAATKATSVALVDINSASADELSALQGIGKVYSDKIIGVYNKVKDQIIAKQK